MSEAHLQSLWARLLMASFADAGVRQVVISPGSRSTPWVLAAAEHPALCCRHLIDERSAAFFALGQARVSGRPSLLICTSGTAGAHYFPAVIEAAMDHVPLLVLTADRPLELAHCGANQTIDQVKLYGDHARRFFELGLSDGTPGALRALRRTAAQAVFASLYPTPGAVHLNARARQPLEPEKAASADEDRRERQVARLLARPIVAPSKPRLEPDSGAIDTLVATCRRVERGLIVAGPAAMSQAASRDAVVTLAERLGLPILSETASQLRLRPSGREGTHFVDAFDAILGSARFRAAQRPELILQIGRSPVSGLWERYLEEHDGHAQHWLIEPHGWHDPKSSATHRLVAELDAVLAALLARLSEHRAESRWLAGWRRADDRAWRVITSELRNKTELSEGRVAQLVAESLPPRGLLGLGNSLAIRQFDTYVRGSGIDALVWSQRGASGIDGMVSGIAGAAVMARRPAALLTGDVSLLHDLSGLPALTQVSTPLALVVVNNDGGRIFEQLPLARHPAASGAIFDHWLTPHGRGFAAAADLAAVPYQRVTLAAELSQALAVAFERSGPTLIEAVVPPHGANEQKQRWSVEVREAVVETLNES